MKRIDALIIMLICETKLTYLCLINLLDYVLLIFTKMKSTVTKNCFLYLYKERKKKSSSANGVTEN
jgi:hypothetical protein